MLKDFYTSQIVIAILLVIYLIIAAFLIFVLSLTTCAHAILGLASTVLIGFAIIIFRFFRGVRTNQIKYAHLTVHILASVFFAVGYFTEFNSIPTNVVHRLPGYIIIGFYIGQFIVAFLTFICPCENPRCRLYFAPFHDLLGIWLFLCLIGICLTGYYSPSDSDEDLLYTIYRHLFNCLICVKALIVVVVVVCPFFEWELVGFI